MKNILLIFIVFVVISDKYYAQTFVYEGYVYRDVGYNGREGITNIKRFEADVEFSIENEKGKALNKMFSISKRYRDSYKDLFKTLSTVDNIKDKIFIDFVCNDDLDTIYLSDLDLEISDKIIIRHYLINNTYEFEQYPLGRRLDPRLDPNSSIIKLISKACKKNYKTTTWTKNLSDLNRKLNQINNYLLPQEWGFTSLEKRAFQMQKQKRIIFYKSYLEEIKDDSFIYDDKFLYTYNRIDSTYNLFRNRAGKIIEFDDFINTSGQNGVNKFLELISYGEKYLNNNYSNYTLNEFRYYQVGSLPKGSNINFLTNIELLKNLNPDLFYRDNQSKIYYRTNSNDIITDIYSNAIIVGNQAFIDIAESYTSYLVNKYQKYIISNIDDYLYQEVDNELSSFDQTSYKVCMATNSFYDDPFLITRKFFCESNATTTVYKTIDKRYLIPEKKWYKFELRDGRIFVDNWGFFDEIAIYDFDNFSIKIATTDNSPLTIENEYLSTLEFIDYLELRNKYLEGTFRFDILIEDESNFLLLSKYKFPLVTRN